MIFCDKIRTALKNRNSDLDITPAIELDEKRREILAQVESMKAKQNEITKQIPAYYCFVFCFKLAC